VTSTSNHSAERSGSRVQSAGGIKLTIRDKSASIFARETQARWPYAIDYSNKKYGPRGWSNAETLILRSAGRIRRLSSTWQSLSSACAAKVMAPCDAESAHLVASRKQIFTLNAQQDSIVLEGRSVALRRWNCRSVRDCRVLTLAGKTGLRRTLRCGPWLVRRLSRTPPADSPRSSVAVLLDFWITLFQRAATSHQHHGHT